MGACSQEGGYRALVPVDPMSVADPEQRRQWQTTRGMQVFSFWETTTTRPTLDAMLAPLVSREPSAWGTWEAAEALRRWSFSRRTPQPRAS